MPGVAIKSVQEIKAKLRDLLHKAGNRFIADHLRPCPENCAGAPKVGSKVQPCARCKANPLEPCKLDPAFTPRYTVQDLKDMFQDLLRKREWVLRTHRDIAMLLWVLGQLESSEEPDPPTLPAHLMSDPSPGPSPWIRVKGDTLQVSPELVPALSALLANLPTLLDSHDASLEGRTLGKGPRPPA